MAKIVLEHVRKVYDGKVVAVDDMNLEIPDGEIVSLLGPSGCGKTTTMRLIAGFEDVDEGRIMIDDQEVTTWPPNRRNLSMVFQFPVVYDTMSIYDNMAIPLRSQKMAESRIRDILLDVSESTKIPGKKKPPNYPSVIDSALVWPTLLPSKEICTFSMSLFLTSILSPESD